jgi:sarcosine oxidase/L-pipecolate oxidase
MTYKPPSSILIIGSGAFGLSTAFSLTKDTLFKDTSITVIDRLPFPAPDGASVEHSLLTQRNQSY